MADHPTTTSSVFSSFSSLQASHSLPSRHLAVDQAPSLNS